MADGPVADERWLRIKALFASALEQPAGAVGAWLDAQCGDDAELRREVEALIASHRSAAGAFMETPAIAGPGAARAVADRVVPGIQAAMTNRLLGPYRLVTEIGRGGMGVVYLAERDDQAFDRQVAIKMVYGAVLHPSLVDRFEAERRILARFEHPNIARLLDAGTDDSGTPFAVMEYVEGTPIDVYARDHRLSIAQRLDLFCTVCDAVQYSHERLVVHRDIKPGNVLVTTTGVPKLLDFGIAKLLDSSGGTERTRTDLRALTPESASPEQVRGDPITVASDVYSLGVLLFRLLTETSPYGDAARSDTEMTRAICEKEPARPSDAVAGSGTGLSPREAAARRREIRGDLDWITIRSLEKDPARRYATASDLAADIRRHLSDQPVLARAPGAIYRTRKFVRRHRLAVGAVTVFVVLLAAFALTMAAQARRIARERDRAGDEARAKEQIAAFLKQLFRLSDPSRARGNTVTAREILDAGVKKIDATIAGQPALRADLFAETADVYESLGLYDESAGLQRRALDLRRQALGAEHLKTLSDTRRLAALLDIRLGRTQESEQLLTPALAVARRVLGEDHDETLKIEGALANALTGLRRYGDAEPLFLDVIARRRRLFGQDDLSTLVAVSNLSGLYQAQKRFEESSKLDQDIVATRRRALGEDHPQTLGAMNNLAYSLMTLRRYDQSRAVIERAMVLGQKVWGTDHPMYGMLLHTRGELAAAVGDLRLAETHLTHTLAAYEHGNYAMYRPLALYELAQVSARLGKRDRALDLLAQALEAGYEPEGSAPPIKEDPQLASLRAHPRFKALLSTPRR